jgi:hypothetical protein
LPSIKGYLESKNTNVEIIDINIEFFDYILTKEFLLRCYNKCFAEFSKMQNEEIDNHDDYIKLSKVVLLKKVIEEVETAKQILKSREFYDEVKIQQVFNVIRDALFIVSSSYDGLNIDFHSITFRYSEKKTSDLLMSLTDKESNPFIEYYDYWINAIRERGIQFIGIAITGSSQFIPALTLARLIKEQCKNVKHITFGGNFITRLAMSLKTRHAIFDFADSIILYEGEEPLRILIESVENNCSLANVPNLCYIENSKLFKNNIQTVNIDNLEMPNFDGFSLEKYLMPELILPLYTSRSCYNKCTFCTIPYATSGKYRVLNIDKVFKMMCYLSEKYGTQYFTMVDETFEVKRMESLALEIISNRKEFFWYCETRFTNYLTLDVCKSLFKSGCRKIQFGLESYNQNVLDKMKKNINIDWIEPNIDNCIKSGIAVHLFFMTGFPTERREEAIRTYQFTNEMLNRSIYKYNNKFSTRGFGTFGLDKYSYVWQNPEEFCIEIVNNDQKDLCLQDDYQAYEGLTTKEASEIVEMFSSNNLNRLIKDCGYRNFFQHHKEIASEERNFLLAVNVNDVEKAPERKIRIRYKVNELEADSIFRLDKYTKYAKLIYDIFRDDLIHNETIVLYNSRYHTVYQIGGNITKLVDKMENNGVELKEVVSEFGVSANKIIEDLLFYNLINMTPELETRIEIFEDGLMQFNDNIVQLYERKDRTWYLFNKNTGNLLKVNKLSYDILKLFEEPLRADDVLQALVKEKIIRDKEKVNNLIYQGLRDGILFVGSA